MNFILREVLRQQEITPRFDHVLRCGLGKERKMVESDHMINIEGRHAALHIWCNFHNTLVLGLF